MTGTMGFKQGAYVPKQIRQQLKKQTINTVCVANHAGIITLITPSGTIECYRQRGIGQLTKSQMQNLIATRQLDREVLNLKDLPKNYHCKFEEGSRMGRCIVNFNKQKYGL